MNSAAKFERKTLEQQTYIYVEKTTTLGPEIADAMSAGFGELFMLLQKAGVTPLSAPMAIYPQMPAGNQMTFRTAFIVNEVDLPKLADQALSDVLPAGDAFTGVHVGPYMNLNLTHQALWKHMEAEGASGTFVWEVYIDDPGETPEAELRTQIFRGVAD